MPGASKFEDRSIFGKFPVDRRNLASRSSFVSVTYWHYRKQNFGTPSNIQSQTVINLLDNTAFDEIETGRIEEEISSCTVSKSLSYPSANFELNLLPTTNWKEKISPGDWVAIYFFDTYRKKDAINDERKNLVLLGNIDRVARSISKDDETDKIELRYIVSGRNFGKVFEDTEIWYNPFSIQTQYLDVTLRKAGLMISGGPSELVENILKIFLGPGANLPNQGNYPAMGQWRIPTAISNLFQTSSANSASKPVFFDILRNQITLDLPGKKAVQQLNVDANGTVWDILKRSSNSVINEMFVEEVRDSSGIAMPTIVLRPKPFNTPFIDDLSYRKNIASIKNSIIRFQDLALTSYVEISPAEIRYENIGKDDHSRFNLFWLTPTNNLEYLLSPTANVDTKSQIGNPTFCRQSILRYGLKRCEQSLEFCSASNFGMIPNIELEKAFLVQLYDMNFANHLYDSGTIECTGVLEAELGKVLIILPHRPKDPKKAYYVEGYEHKWQFPNIWSTTFTVSHGQFVDKNNPFIDAIFAGRKASTVTTVNKSSRFAEVRDQKTGDLFLSKITTTDTATTTTKAAAGDNGQSDVVVDNVYVAKTQTEKE